ncbi:MAG TPA: protoporphyrinogen oxidase HemJ [Hyphomicrobiaceae bacterium]|nr:protoporphyrinogen oxidase HemJ [Hyphomicrobiaceae bacterium]
MGSLITNNPGVRAAIALTITIAATAMAVLMLGSAAYPWVKAIHVIAIIAWMAGMLYLPRLFIYHCAAPVGGEMSETFKVMERRLLTIIINPSMVIAWILGLWLAWDGGWLMAGWFHAKLALALAMSAMHGYLTASVRRFQRDENTISARHWRMLNEVPTVLMIGIVILVIVKPF